MAKIVLKESDLQRMIKDAINEGIKDKFMNGASKLGSKVKKGVKDLGSTIKKGWDNYEEWCKDGLEAENPSQVDFKEFGKETLKDMGSKVKKGWNKYKNWVEKDMDAPNPSYLGDPKDLEECGVKESLHRLIKESVKEVLREAYSDAQYAHLAGQAYAATNSLGGKIKGMFNPQWKRRKERQMKKFADQATGGAFGSQYSQSKNSEYNGGDKRAHYYGYSGKGPTYDYVKNQFNKDNKETPFEFKRNSYHFDKDAPFDKAFTPLNHDGEVLTRQDVLDKRNEFLKNDNLDKNKEWSDVSHTNYRLNRAFDDGKNSVKKKGKTQQTVGGKYSYDTGTKGGNFKKWK